jgi:hypothetical protein
MFDDHKKHFARPVLVRVVALISEPADCYDVQAPHTTRHISAFEDELYRPREEWR